MKLNVCATAVLALAFTATRAGEPELQWETDGFMNPESVLHDAANDVLYVSNVNGDPAAKDGNGFISKVSVDGKMLAREWITGLSAPKGLAIGSGKLYVADIDTLVEIDPTSGAITARYPDPTAKFMNDVAAGGDGAIYVSDSATNRIYRFKDGKLEAWIESADLAGLNGLFAEPDRLLVAAWGDEKARRPGRVLAVSHKDKSITTVSSSPMLGFLDGIEAAADGSYYVTDWVAGRVLRVGRDGNVETLLQLKRGSADLEYMKDGSIVVPLMMDGRVAAYGAGATTE